MAMIRFRRRLSADHPVVGDHRVGGIPVLPAAAQVDAMLTACDAARPGNRWRLDQVAFLAPLSVAGPQFEIETTMAESGECSVSSWQPDGAGSPSDADDGSDRTGGRNGTWPVHSRARATGSALPPPHYLNVAELRAGCADEMPLAAVAEWRRASGIDYGPAFHAIRAVHRGPGRMVALLRASENLPDVSFVPPPLLDSVFQCLGILDEGAVGPCLPWYVGRIEVRRRITGTVLAMVEHTGAGDGTHGVVRGRATVCNQQGEVLLELDRIVLRRAEARRVRQTARPPSSGPAIEARPANGSVTSPTWLVTVPTPEPPSTDRTTLVVSPGAAERAGHRQVVRLTPEDLRGERIEARLAEAAPREVVYVAPRDVRDAEAAMTALRGVFTLVQRLAAHPPMPDLTIVTNAAHSVTGREIVEPLQTALWGLARTLRIEYPHTRVRLVDVDASAAGAPLTLDEIRHAQPELAWRDGCWYAPSLTPISADRPPAEIGGGRFLITGGMGGIGLHVAEFLAREGCAHLTLVGRTVPEQGEPRQRLDQLAAACDLDVVRADVRSLRDALREARSFDGVFHAAGVLRDGLARSLTSELIDQVFAPKIGGVHALDGALAQDARPGFVVLFSSISAVHGNLGQSCYATANAYLDGYAARRRAQGESWYSLGWGLWTIGMGAGIVRSAAARGISALTVEDGITLLRTTLSLPPANYVLSAAPKSKDQQMTLVTPQRRLWTSLSAIVQKTLHVNNLSLDDNLLELGLDSMMAVEAAAAFSAEGLDVDPATFFEHTDVDALLNHLEALPRTTTVAAPTDLTSVTEPAPGLPPAAPAAHVPAQPATRVPALAREPVRPARPPAGPPPSVGTPFVPDWDRFRDLGASLSPERPAALAGDPPGRAAASAVRSGPPRSTAPTGRTGPTGLPDPPGGGPTPGRTLPSRLSGTPDSSFLNHRIDALSAEDRAIVAQNDYFYEPVIEDAEGSWIKFDGRWFLNLASYSYLGLIGHDYINRQAQRAVERHGTGAHGVRLLAGTLHLHRELELVIARFLGTEDSIVFSSGYLANVATVGALVGPDDVIIGDVYNHASILDGYRLSGAKVITYAHNDLADLERALRKVGSAGRLVVTDAVFSMDGDIADLPGIVELCERYDAPLMVDEAHSLGVLGATGRGITEHFGIDPVRVPVKMGTLSKTVPSAGGYVAGSSDLVFALKNNARGWMFSAAATPPQVAAAKAAVEVMEAAPRLTGELRVRTDRYRRKLGRLGFDTLASQTPVVPIICGSAEQAHTMARLSQRDGLFVQPIVYPAVPRALPRLRTIVNLSHSDDDLDEAVAVLEKAGRRAGLIV